MALQILPAHTSPLSLPDSFDWHEEDDDLVHMREKIKKQGLQLIEASQKK